MRSTSLLFVVSGLIAGSLIAADPVSFASADEITYARHIAPIVLKHCAGCHRPGEVGPFSLLTYDDAAKRADFLKELTASKRMPPWKAEAGFGSFLDERRLSPEEINLIATWADSGAKLGEPSELPPAPEFPHGWQLGEPDLVLKMVQPFQVPADGKDIYQCFTIPIPIDRDQMVSAVEFRPGNAKVVHHAILYLDSSGQARALDPDGAGYRSFGGPGILPSGGLGAWVPGSVPRHLADGLGKYLRQGSDLVLQVHYHPTGKLEEDRSTIGIHFAKKPVTHLVGGLAVRSRALNIPAGESRHHVTASSQPLPAAANVIAIAPHMHLIGREMKVVAVEPDGKETALIWIKDWDFNWQGAYFYAEPVRLPQGSVVKLDAWYDNSENNPQNPQHPPATVRWGEQTTDEMCLLGLQVTADSLADLRKIGSQRGGALGTALFGGLPPGGDEVTPDLSDVVIPEDGIPIPDQYRTILAVFDRNQDNRLTKAEIDRMPERLRTRVLERIRGLIP